VPYILITYIFVAFLIFSIPKSYKSITPFILSSIQLGAFLFFISQVSIINNGLDQVYVYEWIPAIGLNFEFALTGLSLAFVLLITGIGALVFLYAGAYMKAYSGTDKFYFYLFLFSAAMLGLVLSANMIQLFIFWELTSFLSFLLISFFHEKESARKAAFQSLFITGSGGLLLLTGIIFIGNVAQSYSYSDWLAQADIIKESSFYLPGLILILIGAFTKSAQFPFHFWLPGAMQAPTPVSSYLHSATMVKAGFFLLIMLNPILGGTTAWTYIIPLFGVTTMLVGSYFAITQTDLKSILAYTTISALGILILLVGIDTVLSIKAAILFLFIHAFYKATLFMIAGFIDKKTGTKELSKLGGLIRYMPFTFIIAVLALFSMAGLPPMLGFLGKELIYEAKVQSPGIASLVLILGVTSNILMIAVSLLFIKKVFLGKPASYKTEPNEKGWMYIIGPFVLALLSLIFGLFPNLLGDSIVEPALRNVVGEYVNIKLNIWHGFNKVFFLSLFTVLSGFGLFYLLIKKPLVLEKWKHLNSKLFKIEFSEVFSNGIDNFISFSKRSTSIIQHGFHRYYILTIIIVTTILLWIQVYITRGWILETEFSFNPFYITGVVVLVSIAAIFSAISKSRITTIIAMGVVGYGISLIYLYYSAVDLAITQIIVETLTVVVFVIVLQRLPRFAKLSSKATKLRDLLIALSFGAVMTVLALKAIHVEFNRPISDFFIKNSLDQAYGKNVVNVILVDFRALDTLGEITVLTIAALGVYVLLKRKKS
jgi:multicomponent Na+:H+ antiporter subunit A